MILLALVLMRTLTGRYWGYKAFDSFWQYCMNQGTLVVTGTHYVLRKGDPIYGDALSRVYTPGFMKAE